MWRENLTTTHYHTRVILYNKIFSPDLLVPKLSVLRHRCIDGDRHTFLDTGSRTTSPTAESLLPVGETQSY